MARGIKKFKKSKRTVVMTEQNIQAATAKGANEKNCHECGVTINTKAEICPKCGAKQLIEPNNTNTAKSRIVTSLLSIFLGGFGIHKFYLGKVGWGILYFLFFWTWIPMIIGLFEGLIYLTMSDQEFTKVVLTKPPTVDEPTETTQQSIPKPVKAGISLTLVVLLIIASIAMVPVFLFMVLAAGLSGNSSVATNPTIMSMYIPFFLFIGVVIWVILKK